MGADLVQLQRTVGNRAVTGLLVQREAEVSVAPPYPTTHAPPDFEYWVNSMWKQVVDDKVRDAALADLQGGTDAPRAEADLDQSTKTKVLRNLYDAAYKEAVWYDAEKLIAEGSLDQKVTTPTRVTIAAGFHGTARDPKTVLESHKGTVPTIERHGKDPTDSPGIQAYLKTKLGIHEWHPFWFSGDIAKRPFLFRNNEGDNELDTTISVAKSAMDSLDFPMPESDTMKAPSTLSKLEAEAEKDPDGLMRIETFVYLVGVTQGFGTSKKLQGTNAFGEGEIATQKLDPDDHLGYSRYQRRFFGGSRNDGFTYERIHTDVLPGARRRNISEKVNGLVQAMPNRGQKNCTAPLPDLKPMYATLEEAGRTAAVNAIKSSFARRRLAWTAEEWAKDLKGPEMDTAPTPTARRVRQNAYLKGIRSVLGKTLPVTQEALDQAVAANNIKLSAPIVVADIGKPAAKPAAGSKPGVGTPPPRPGSLPLPLPGTGPGSPTTVGTTV